MNNDFEPNKNADSDNPIRRGYEPESTPESTPSTAPETEAPTEPTPTVAARASDAAGEQKDWRFKAEPLGDQSQGGGNNYYDFTKAQGGGASGGQGGYLPYTPISQPLYTEKNSSSTVALALGIIGLALGLLCCGLMFMSVLLGVIGIIFAIKSRRNGQLDSKALAGLITSIFAIVLGAFGALLWVAFIVGFIEGLSGAVGDGGIVIQLLPNALARLLS